MQKTCISWWLTQNLNSEELPWRNPRRAQCDIHAGVDDADCLRCVEYTNTMTGVRSQKGLSGSVGASRCSSKSSIKESALSARASSHRGTVWKLGEVYLRPRACCSITKLRSKVISCERAHSAYRKVLWVSVGEAVGSGQSGGSEALSERSRKD